MSGQSCKSPASNMTFPVLNLSGHLTQLIPLISLPMHSGYGVVFTKNSLFSEHLEQIWYMNITKYMTFWLSVLSVLGLFKAAALFFLKTYDFELPWT